MTDTAGGVWPRWLELTTLTSFAVAAPLFDLLERNPELLVAHRFGAPGVCWLTAGLVVVPAALCCAIQWVAGRIDARAGGAVHSSLVGLLAGMTVLAPLNRIEALPPVLAVLLALVFGSGIAWWRGRAAPLRTLLHVLAVAPIVFAIAFWTSGGISRVRSPIAWSLPKASAARPEASVVLVVFDALPLVTLLDADGGIDADRFPQFARLAAQSTWFRNTTAASEATKYAVPAIVTGRLPEPGQLPTVGDHPGNLFTLLRDSHTLGVRETRTMLAPIDENLPATGASAPSRFVSDLAILYAHVLAPSPLRARLPVVSEDWRDFAPTRPRDTEKLEGIAYGRDRPERFRRFVSELGRCERPCLDFVHIVFPHTPWIRLPSGRAYTPIFVPGIAGGRWGPHEFWAAQGQQRHIFQALLADRLLGEMLDRLEALGRLDDTLVSVLADHGASFWAGESRRKLAGHAHPEDILRVPWLLKLPGQRNPIVDDRRAHTVDVLPTLADALGVAIPWPVDGISALALAEESRTERVAYSDDGKAHRYPGDLDVRASVDARLSRFAPGNAGLFTLGRYGRWVGSRLTELRRGGVSRCRIEIAKEAFFVSELHVPARISGFVRCGPRRHAAPHVGIAIGGIVRSVAPAFRTQDGEWLFTTFVDEHAIDAGGDLLTFLFEGDTDAPRLRAARYSFEEIARPVVESRLAADGASSPSP